jgi:integrase
VDVQQARAALAKGSIKLTNKTVRELPAPPTGSVIYTDGSILEVRVTAAGARAWVFRYRHVGRSVTHTIGNPENMKASAASREADRLYELVRQGRDPHGEKKAEHEAPTMRDLARRTVADHFSNKRPATRVDVYGDEVNEKTGDPLGGQLAKWIIPTLGTLKVDAVRPADIERLHSKVTKAGSPIRANRCVSTISKMMSLAIRWEWRTDGINPCRSAVERNPENQRQRYLKPPEIIRLGEALAAYPSQAAANAVRLLILTGARRTEVLAAPWSQFDLEAGTWTKPSSDTKQKKLHHVPLSAPALELLFRMKEDKTSEYLFPGRGTDHLTDIKKAWAAISAEANFDGPTRLHDLRHTVASVAVSGGASLPMIGALLGHASPATTARYAHLYVDPVRAVADGVGAIMTQQPKAEVVPMRGRR